MLCRCYLEKGSYSTSVALETSLKDEDKKRFCHWTVAKITLAVHYAWEEKCHIENHRLWFMF